MGLHDSGQAVGDDRARSRFSRKNTIYNLEHLETVKECSAAIPPNRTANEM